MTVNRDLVVKKLVGVKVHNEEGIINAFDVILSHLPLDIWINLYKRLIEAVPDDQKDQVVADHIQCNTECGYHTGQGVLQSNDFKGVVEPMITDGKKDILRACFACLTAWGYAKTGIVQIKEGERMVIRAKDYAETQALMLKGISAAFFDLVYGGEYPDSLGTFDCEQTSGIEFGDPFSEFVITKKE